jgi:hypothetical protein
MRGKCKVQKEFWLESLQGRDVGMNGTVMDLGEIEFKGLIGFN